MNVKLLQGDCLELMKEIPDGSIDLTVTSPPYDNLRTYNKNAEWTYEKFQGIAKELYRITCQGGIVVWIVNDAVIDRSETGTSFRQALYFKDCGFNIHDTMIWQKCGVYPDKKRYRQDFEYMFIFSKGTPKTTNIICDRPNKYCGVKVCKSSRQRDGSIKKSSASKLGGRRSGEYGQRYNIWSIPPCNSSKERTGHPAQFPEQLAHDHIISWSNEGDTVLDPFMGSGTTGVACVNTGRSFIGIEIDKNYFQLAQRRIDNNNGHQDNTERNEKVG